ncbi:MAG TPA: hypothetical protein VN039_05680 [Nitrospira sp.]|nr:hypothetical protein [Nitrospira sp.]
MTKVFDWWHKHEAWIAFTVVMIAVFGAGYMLNDITNSDECDRRVEDIRQQYERVISAKEQTIELLARSTAQTATQAATASAQAVGAATIATQAAQTAQQAAQAADKATDSNKKALGKLK